MGLATIWLILSQTHLVTLGANLNKDNKTEKLDEKLGNAVTNVQDEP
jgi:hypothetical protein